MIQVTILSSYKDNKNNMSNNNELGDVVSLWRIGVGITMIVLGGYALHEMKGLDLPLAHLLGFYSVAAGSGKVIHGLSKLGLND